MLIAPDKILRRSDNAVERPRGPPVIREVTAAGLASGEYIESEPTPPPAKVEE